MITCDGVRKWFRLPERLVIFTFGLLFSKGMMIYVLANFMTFLTNTWNLKLKEAAAIVNFQEGLRDMLQIHVALCIDAWLGYRRMLILSSVLYCAGLGLLAFSVPQTQEVHPMENVDYFKKLKHTPFWEGLALLIVGGAAQVIPLSSLSFDQTKVVKVPEHYEPTRVKIGCFLFKVKVGGWRQLQQRFIRLLCTAVKMLGTITFVYGFISFERRWQLYFLVSASGIAVGLLWFLCGLPLYGLPRLQPNPLSTMLRVLIAAVRKRHLINQENLYGLHRCDGDDQNLTGHLECLNNAAVKESPADDNSIMKETRWKLCTVKEVEQTKLLLNIFPMSVTFIVYGMVKSLGNTFFIEQANSMRGGNGILIVVFQMIQGFSKSPIKRGYEVVFKKRIDRIKRRYSDGVKIGLGMLASIICCALATSVESKRLKALPPSLEGLPNDPNAIAHISALWLVPQFLFLGAMEGLAGDGIQDFYGHYAPDSRRYGPVFTSSLTGLGAVLSMGFIAILDYYSKSRYNESWLGDSINQSRLDSIYHAYVIVALINCFLYAYVAKQYSYDNITGREEEEEEEEEEIQFLEVKEETAAGDEQNDQEQVSVELQRISVR